MVSVLLGILTGVYYETVGSEGSRQLIIQMQDQVYWSARDGFSVLQQQKVQNSTQLLGKLF